MSDPPNYAGSLHDLSQIYLQAAELQTERIARTREQYNRLPNKHSGQEAYRLYSRLQALYSQRRELLETSAYLRNYYRFSNTNSVES